jgi:hypothetical protein
MKKRDFTISAVILGILLLCLISGCAGAGKNILPSPDSGETTGLPPADPYQPPAQAKAGDLSVTLKVGWNLIRYPVGNSKKFTAVTMTRNGETKLLNDAVTAGWTQNKVRFMKGRGIQLIGTGTPNAAFLPGGQYYVFSYFNKVLLEFNKPLITSIDPSSAPAGAPVSINGINFGTVAGTVTFTEGKTAEITSWTDTQIVCTAPDGIATGPLRVAAHGSQSNTAAFTVMYPVAGDFYVSASNGSDGNPGTPSRPFKTITRAMSAASSGQVVIVEGGTYALSTNGETVPVQVGNGIQLKGSYHYYFTQRDFVNHLSVIDGESAPEPVYDYREEWDPEGNPIIIQNLIGFTGRQISVVVTFSGPGNTTLFEGFKVTGRFAYGGSGGAFYCDGTSPAVNNCVISGNSCYGGWGAGVYCGPNASPVFNNCIVTGNSNGAGHAAGFFCKSPEYMLDFENPQPPTPNNSHPVINNCTISGNSAATDGGIKVEGYDIVLTVNNSIVTDPIGGQRNNEAGTSSINMYNSDYGSLNVNELNTSFTACMSVDPIFAGGSDLHLQPGSPCINAGNSSLVPGGITFDFDGNPRIVNTIVDMGAFEKQ